MYTISPLLNSLYLFSFIYLIQVDEHKSNRFVLKMTFLLLFLMVLLSFLFFLPLLLSLRSCFVSLAFKADSQIFATLRGLEIFINLP